MFSHIYIGVTDFDRALAFYGPVLASLGLEARFCDRERWWAGWQCAGRPRPLFLIGAPFDGVPHARGNGQMVALLADTRAGVDRAFEIALAQGGTSEGAPGLRPQYHAAYYGAYFRDPDGNKLCVACHSPDDAPAARSGGADPDAVTLREITADTVRAVLHLTVAESQKGFVAPNAVSLSQALFAPEAWYRAIHAGDDLVGFVMLEDESLRVLAPARPAVSVWRFMIDHRHQRRGLGRAALLRVIAHVRSKGVFTALQLSYVPGPGCPEPFYSGLGFMPTGRMDGHEVVLELPLAPGLA